MSISPSILGCPVLRWSIFLPLVHNFFFLRSPFCGIQHNMKGTKVKGIFIHGRYYLLSFWMCTKRMIWQRKISSPWRPKTKQRKVDEDNCFPTHPPQSPHHVPFRECLYPGKLSTWLLLFTFQHFANVFFFLIIIIIIIYVVSIY